MTIGQIIRQELKALFHYKLPALYLLLGIPLIYTLLFGLAYSSHVIKHVPAVIYDQDQTSASRALTQAFLDSEKLDVVSYVSTQEEMEAALTNNRALVAVAIPPDFQRHIKLGLGTEVVVITNGANVSFSNTVITASQEIVQTFSAGTGKKLLEAANQMPAVAMRTVAPVKLSIRITGNPVTSYTNFMLTGLGINGLQIALMLTVGTLIIKEFAAVSIRTTAPIALIFGKLVPYWLTATGIFMLITGLAVSLFEVPFRGSWSQLLLLGSGFTFAVTAVCLFFSSIARDEVDALQKPLLYFMPGLLFSGLSWPQFAMNDISRYFSAIMPLTYTADSLRDLLLAGYSPSLLKNVCIMYGAGLAVSLLAAFVVSVRLKRADLQQKEVAL